MDGRTVQLLFALLRSAVRGEQLTDAERELYLGDVPRQLSILSKRHDMAHLAAYGLEANLLRAESEKGIKNEMMKAVYRYEQLHYEYGIVCDALETAHIPFIPLKGSVLRDLYPEPWMRTSCDIDILVHPQDTEAAVAYLAGHCQYTRMGSGSHDISLLTPSGQHVELHFDLVEEGLVNAASGVLRAVWDKAVPHGGGGYRYDMSDGMFYFYHVAHMAKHFVHGGCGIRPFLDLWILDNSAGANKQERDELLRAGDLLTFAEVVRTLSRVWFDGAEHTDLTRQTEYYILRGGVYGTNENRITVEQQRQGGRARYALSKLFLPYDTIKFHYPVLQKHRWLTPLMEVRRWGSVVFGGRARRAVRELTYNQSITDEVSRATADMLKNLGLYRA